MHGYHMVGRAKLLRTTSIHDQLLRYDMMAQHRILGSINRSVPHFLIGTLRAQLTRSVSYTHLTLPTTPYV